jgi:hypothetical protein
VRQSGDNAFTVVNLQVHYFLAELCLDVSMAVDALKRLTATA